MCCHGNGLILRGIIAPFLVYTGVYEHGNERGYSYGVSKYFPPARYLAVGVGFSFTAVDLQRLSSRVNYMR